MNKGTWRETASAAGAPFRPGGGQSRQAPGGCRLPYASPPPDGLIRVEGGGDAKAGREQDRGGESGEGDVRGLPDDCSLPRSLTGDASAGTNFRWWRFCQGRLWSGSAKSIATKWQSTPCRTALWGSIINGNDQWAGLELLRFMLCAELPVWVSLAENGEWFLVHVSLKS